MHCTWEEQLNTKDIIKAERRQVNRHQKRLSELGIITVAITYGVKNKNEKKRTVSKARDN